MRFLKKLIILLAVAGAVAVAAVFAPAMELFGSGAYPLSRTAAAVTASAGGYTMELDTATLGVTVTKEGAARIWRSGERHPEDGFTDIWAKRVTDGFTVGYRDLSTNYVSERAITSLGASAEITPAAGGFSARVSLASIGVSFTARFTLEGGALVVRVPFSQIIESSQNFRLMYLIPFNYFENSYSITDGFILVPDGSGAVIDLSTVSGALQPYSQRMYDGDRGVAGIKSRAYNVYAPQMPVFGILYGGEGAGGFLAHIGAGAEYAEINARVPAEGSGNNYNCAYARFIYREEYTRYFESTGTEGKSYIAFQDNANNFDIEIRYILLDETAGDLSAAANGYRDYLLSAGILGDKKGTGKTGLMLQYLMAENKPSMFGSTTLQMTSPDFIVSKLNEVTGYCPNLKIALSGYTKGGISGSYPQHFPVEGGEAAYKRLLSAAAEKGAEVSFITDFVQAYDDGSGYSKKDLAMSVAEQFIGVNGIPNSASAMTYSGYNALTVNATKERLNADLKSFKKLGAGALTFNNIGGLLYSGFKNQSFTRGEQAEAYRALLQIAGVTRNIPLPNQYMWAVCDAFLDAPAASSGYMIETRDVPFLQMVLSGYIPMYRKPLNLNYLGAAEKLRMIDYNLYPCFLLTQRDAIELYGTQSAYIFTSAHADWADTVKDVYQSVSAVLDAVAGERFISRQEVSPQVFVNGYSGGKRVYVNYTGADYAYEGAVLAAASGGLL